MDDAKLQRMIVQWDKLIEEQRALRQQLDIILGLVRCVYRLLLSRT